MWPFHPAVPVTQNDELKADCYLETHFPCITTSDKLESLKEISNKHNAHLSRNMFVKMEDGKFVQMLTPRKNTYLNEFKELYYSLKQDLSENEFSLARERPDIEYAFYDTNQTHDAAWVGKNKIA